MYGVKKGVVLGEKKKKWGVNNSQGVNKKQKWSKKQKSFVEKWSLYFIFLDPAPFPFPPSFLCSEYGSLFLFFFGPFSLSLSFLFPVFWTFGDLKAEK